MNFSNLYSIFFLCAVVICLITSFIIWTRRSMHGGYWLFLSMLAITVWNFFDFLQYSSNSLAYQVFWGKMLYIGACSVMPLILIFFLQYSFDFLKLSFTTKLLFFIVPVLSLISALTNEYHWLFWSSYQPVSSESFPFINFIYGPIYWLDLSYNYLCALVVILIFIHNIWFSKELVRFQFSNLLIISIVPFIAGLVFTFNLNPFPDLDILPVAFSIGGVGIAVSILIYHLLDIVPIARNSVIENMDDAVIVLDQQNRILDINPVAKTLLGCKGKKIIGQNAAPLFQSWPGLMEIIQNPEGIAKEISRDQENQKQHFHIQVSYINRQNNLEDGLVIVLRDITPIIFAQEILLSQLTEIQSLKNELQEQAIRDPLTNLYNRRYLQEFLEREFARAQREGYPVSLVMADVDHFKEVNDSYGHIVGDKVLQTISSLFDRMCRAGDFVCRYGGEEFLLVLPNISYEIASIRAEQWRLSLPKIPISSSELQVRVTLSFGVAAFPSHGNTPADVIAAADNALYQAKLKGRNQVVRGGDK